MSRDKSFRAWLLSRSKKIQVKLTLKKWPAYAAIRKVAVESREVRRAEISSNWPLGLVTNIHGRSNNGPGLSTLVHVSTYMHTWRTGGRRYPPRITTGLQQAKPRPHCLLHSWRQGAQELCGKLFASTEAAISTQIPSLRVPHECAERGWETNWELH